MSEKPVIPPAIQWAYDKLVQRFPGPWRRPVCYDEGTPAFWEFSAGEAVVNGPHKQDGKTFWYAEAHGVHGDLLGAEDRQTATAAFAALRRTVNKTTREQLRDATRRVFKDRMAVGLDGIPEDLARVGPEKPMGYHGTAVRERALAWMADARRRGHHVLLVQGTTPGASAWWVHAWDDKALKALLKANEKLVRSMLRETDEIRTDHFVQLVGAIYFDPQTYPAEYALIKACFGGADEGWAREAPEANDGNDAAGDSECED